MILIFHLNYGISTKRCDRTSTCAVNAIHYNPEMKEYYHRKIAEGKHKMLVINNVRNKLLAMIFAVVQKGTPYVEAYGEVEQAKAEITHIGEYKQAM